MSGPGPDDQFLLPDLKTHQVVHGADVDEGFDARGPVLQTAHEIRAARHQTAAAFPRAQGGQAFFQIMGKKVISKIHEAGPSHSGWRLKKIFSAVMGKSLILTPTASSTALATAGGMGMRAGSPMPLAP